ncbi:MAG: hypothetical protein V1691_00885 [Chloroflexota bacterium]
MPNKNPYTWTGLSLLIAGTMVSLTAYLALHLTWLTALGICMLILSFITLALGNTIPRLPPEVCGLLLETGVDNIATVIEELGIRTKAIYLPSSMNGGRAKALIPLQCDTLPAITQKLPHRLIARYGTGPDDIGLLLSTIGTTAVGMLESKPGPASTELESALTALLTGRLAVADKARVTCHENRIMVEINNPRIENRATWSNHCLGGPIASIIAHSGCRSLEQAGYYQTRGAAGTQVPAGA